MMIIKIRLILCVLVMVTVLPSTNAMGLKDMFNKLKSLFPKKTVEKKENFNPLTFLDKYGYGLGIETRQSLLASAYNSADTKLEKNTDLKNMVSLFQSLFDLPITGKLDKKTTDKMMAPRCGFPDILNENDTFQPVVKKQKLEKGPASYVASSSKWRNTALKYRFINYNIELGKDGTRFAINKAFNYWATHAEINFQEVCEKCESDFVIEFAEAEHGDGYAFDGASGVLAHAFFPENGKIHFDEAELFTENTKEGVNLRLVAAHEIGHALGLDHSYVKGALMYPYYAGYVPLDKFDLDQDDILGIRSIYGKRKTPLEPPSRTTTKKTTQKVITTKKVTTKQTTKSPTTKIISPCSPTTHAIDSIFISPENNIHVIVDHDELWEYKSRVWKSYDLLKKYPGIESGVRGGVKCKKGLTWFFKDRRVWAFKGYILMPSYPKRISDRLFPSNPYTATLIGGKMYILKGSFAYNFNTETLKTDGRFPKHVSNIFIGLPAWIENSVEYKNEHYMFKGDMVYKLKGEYGFEVLLRGYPKRINEAWFPCFQSRFRNWI